MGNSQVKTKQKDKFKWAETNTEIVHITSTHAKIYDCDCRKSMYNDNEIICIAVSQDSKLAVAKVKININKKNNKRKKIICETVFRIQLKSSWVLSCALSPSVKYCADGGLGNIVTIYNIKQAVKDNTNVMSHYRELHIHEGYISSLKFLQGIKDDNYILSSSGDGTVILWDINNSYVIKRIDVNENHHIGEVLDIDYIYLHNRHIIVYCAAKTIFISDITSDVYDYEKRNDNIETDEKKQDFESTIGCMVLSQVINEGDRKMRKLSGCDMSSLFKTDAVNCRFSPSGDFIVVLSDAGEYNIYYQQKLDMNIMIDDFSNSNSNTCEYSDKWLKKEILEWKFLAQKHVEKMDFLQSQPQWGQAASLTWADENTIMVGVDGIDKVYCTELVASRSNKNIIDAVEYGVKCIIKDLPKMNWIGLTNEISMTILMYFNDIEIYDYVIVQCGNSVRTACMSSCKWGQNNQNDIVVSGFWNQKLIANIPK
eukprot:148729_1